MRRSVMFLALLATLTAPLAAASSGSGLQSFGHGVTIDQPVKGDVQVYGGAATVRDVIDGDLFVFGDIRDVVREGKHLAMGEDTDRLILGLATAGLAVTAATYASAGGAAPVRAGLTLVKDARKVGRRTGLRSARPRSS